MKCDIHHQKNAHPKTQSRKVWWVAAIPISNITIFPHYEQVWNVYELEVCGDRKKHDANQTKIGFHTM